MCLGWERPFTFQRATFASCSYLVGPVCFYTQCTLQMLACAASCNTTNRMQTFIPRFPFLCHCKHNMSHLRLLKALAKTMWTWTSSLPNTLFPILPQQSRSCNEIGTILCTVPDAKQLWLQTCFPYCHYWGYCNGLITSLLCQLFQRELNHAPPPSPHVCLTHFILMSLLAQVEDQNFHFTVFHSWSGAECHWWLLPNSVGNDNKPFEEQQWRTCAAAHLLTLI